MLITTSSSAQNLNEIGKGGMAVSGNVNLTNSYYRAFGRESRLNPFAYGASGGITFQVYGISVPFTFSYTNQRSSYTQPFNIYGISPTYKRFTLHAGYRSMTFSGYTLNGHNFLGGGLEYNGDRLEVKTMGGRLFKEVAYDSSVGNTAYYARYGTGTMLRFKGKEGNISLIGFYAKDDSSSIPALPAGLGINPQENFVWSVGVSKKIGKKLTIDSELARSAWTRNMNSSDKSSGQSVFYPIPWRESTVVNGAFKVRAGYALDFMTVGLGYEKIDPSYRTMGAYYFNNDLRNITADVNLPLLKGKINVSANAGVQQNDLNGESASKMNRRVGSINISAKPSQRLNMTLGYSNFTSFTNVKPIDARLLNQSEYARVDTLNFTQVSETMSSTIGYTLLESDYVSRAINASGNIMRTANAQNNNSNVGAGMQTVSVGFSQNYKRSGMSLGLNVNTNRNVYQEGNTIYNGVNVNWGMPVAKKKVRTGISVMYNRSTSGGGASTPDANIYSVSTNWSYEMGKAGAFNLMFRYSGTQYLSLSENQGTGSFSEIFGNAGYSYTFSKSKK